MNLRLNRTLFQQTGADSASLTMLAAVIHRPTETGDHAGTVYRGEQPVGEFMLRVVEGGPLQASVDLAGQHLHGDPGRQGKGREGEPCCVEDETTAGGDRVYSVAPNGYAVFHVSGGGAGYAVQLASPAEVERIGRGERPRRRDEAQLWDSRQLQPGDLFAVTLLRPGTYRISNELGGAEANIKLGYPKRGRQAYRPPEALHVAVTDSGFEPKRIALEPIQGQVYEIRAPSRLTITLVEPDDGPRRPERPERPAPPRHRLVRRREPG